MKKNINKCISYYRVLVENYFGRLHTFGLSLQEWKWDEKKYKTCFQTEIALTNASMFFNALQRNDRNLYVAIHNRFYTIGDEKSKKKSSASFGLL